MTVEFIYINRFKRIVVRLLQLLLLTPAALFFILGVKTKSTHTILELQLGFPEYWRIISVVGLLVIAFLYFILYSLLKVEDGILEFKEDRISILKKGRLESEYHFNEIDDVKLEKDIPFKDDERYQSQRASKLIFLYRGKTVILEFLSKDAERYHKLNQYLKEVSLANFKETYRRQPILKWLDF